MTDCRVVDNRVFLLGLDNMCREQRAINNNVIKDFWAPEIWTTERYAENLTST